MRRILFLVLAGMLILVPVGAKAQQVQLDRGLQPAGLWCFPLETDPKMYVYIPSRARLATDNKGRPQFSFVRYVMNTPGESTGAATITAAQGGAILHFLVLYETPKEQVEAAQKALQELLKDEAVVLRGPVVFKEGRFGLVSSILSEESGKPERRLLTAGRAPVLEGNRIALSFDLSPEKATLLMKSFQMATPDVSLVFDMAFEGLTAAYDAELFIDWTEVRKSQGFQAGGSVYFVSADVEVMFDELFRKNAIRLRSRGSDATMEALLTTVYDKLLQLMFRPVEPEKIPESQRGGLADAIHALMDLKKGSLSSRKTTGFGAYVGYQLKEMKTSGKSLLSFNHRSSVERHALITFNIGDFHKRYGHDANYFRTFNLGDPAFQQREVRVSIDGALLPEFERYVNSVTLTLHKAHQSGRDTFREVVLDRNMVDKGPSFLPMVYGWDGDNDRSLWLQYRYRTRWSFKGGGSYETEWQPSDAPMIDLFAPYERRTIQIVGSLEALRQQKVRAVIVKVEYPFFHERRREQVVIRPDRKEEEWGIEVTLPLGKFDYSYAMTWILEGGNSLSTAGTDSSGVLFIDELPGS